MMCSRPSRSRCELSHFCLTCFICLHGLGLMLFAAGCGADLGNRSTADPRTPTLDSTVSDEGDQGNELVSPAGVEEEPSPLTFTTDPSFCCDPLSIEFAVQPPESAWEDDVTYHWDFGDGRTAAGAFVKHTYPWPAEYTVVLTAKRPDGIVERVQHTLSLTSVTEERGLAAYAGPDQVVVAGDLVVLEGDASVVAAADTLAYEWVQIAGPPVDFATRYEAVATFVAPEPAGESDTLIFELTVTEDSLQASDKMLVTVFAKTSDADANTPPIVWDQSALAAVGGTVLLTLDGSDVDGDDLAFSIISSPAHGTLGDIDNSPVSAATVLYAREPDYFGTDTFAFQATDGEAESDVAVYSIPRCEPLTIIPWVECNWPGAPMHGDKLASATMLDYVVEGLLVWKTVTDTAIVSTMPNRADLYTELHRRAPEMRIIPGLKTWHSLERFDSVSGWRVIAREVSAIRATSGERVIVLENETALEDWVKGRETLDTRKLREGLALLPTDMQYLWHPSLWLSAGDEAQQRLMQVCQVVEEALRDVRFLDQKYNAHHSVNNARFAKASKVLHSIASRPTLPMQFFLGTDNKNVWWRDDQIDEALSYVRTDWGNSADVVLYIGQKRWVEAAQSLSTRLPQRGSAAKP